MPNTRSAEKRMRQDEKRRQTNRMYKTTVRTFTRKVAEAVEAKNADEAQAAFKILQERVDKAAKKSAIHPNKAARRKSRLQKQINALKAAAKG